MTDSDAFEWPDPSDKAHSVEQAKRLRNQVAEGGLRFEVYLPPSLGLWLLDRIEQGQFLDPSEAVFVSLGEHKELESYAGLRRELLKHRIEAAADDPRPEVSGEEMKSLLREKRKAPCPNLPHGKNSSGADAPRPPPIGMTRAPGQPALTSRAVETAKGGKQAMRLEY